MGDKYLYTKRRAIYFASKGLSCSATSRALTSEGLSYSTKSVSLLLRKINGGGSIARKPGTGRSTKITQQVKDLKEEQMQADDETTAVELKRKLSANEINLSLSTILRCRRALGWTYRGSAYCQLIREPNKLKRLSWCLEMILAMWFGQMRQVCNWKTIVDSATGNMDKSHVQNQGM